MAQSRWWEAILRKDAAQRIEEASAGGRNFAPMLGRETTSDERSHQSPWARRPFDEALVDVVPGRCRMIAAAGEP